MVSRFLFLRLFCFCWLRMGPGILFPPYLLLYSRYTLFMYSRYTLLLYSGYTLLCYSRYTVFLYFYAQGLLYFCTPGILYSCTPGILYSSFSLLQVYCTQYSCTSGILYSYTHVLQVHCTPILLYSRYTVLQVFDCLYWYVLPNSITCTNILRGLFFIKKNFKIHITLLKISISINQERN